MQVVMRRGGVLVYVLLSVLGVFLVLALAAVGLGVYVARNTTVNERADSVRVETPFGSVRVNKEARADLRLMGIPIYPGASRVDDRRKLASVEFDFGDEHNEFVAMAAEYTTTDPASRVVEFYRERFPGWLFEARHDGRWCLRVSQQNDKRMIAIRQRNGVTHIALASIGEPAAN